MITKRYVVLYKKGKVDRIVDEIQINGENEEECYDEACQLCSAAFRVEEINAEEKHERD